MTEMALLDAAPRPPGLRSCFVEGIGGLGLHVLEAGSSQTWAPGSPSPDPKWRLVTKMLGRNFLEWLVNGSRIGCLAACASRRLCTKTSSTVPA